MHEPVQDQLVRHMENDENNFYFMINPFFPTDAMMKTVGRHLPHLIRYYPSGAAEIAGKIRAVEKINRPLIPVNGSCEAIRVLLFNHPGKKLVLVPNFNEWEIRSHHRLPHDAPTPSISETIEKEGIELVCICNPNNPTGFFRTDIQDLADAHPKVQFAVDISFIDFVHESIPARPKGPNVILVKSLGKNYGMCGLRLGYMACESRAFIQHLRPFFPIWNINSITEFMLDLIQDETDAYEDSRIRIIRGTREMQALLETLPTLTVYPTRANFVMVRSDEPLQFNVKNCSNKTGLDERYYRVAFNKHFHNLKQLIRGGFDYD